MSPDTVARALRAAGCPLSAEQERVIAALGEVPDPQVDPIFTESPRITYRFGWTPPTVDLPMYPASPVYCGGRYQ